VRNAPDPPIRSADPSQAPPEITAELLAGDRETLATIRKVVRAIVGIGSA
jgi:hypothetical protein